MSRMTNDVENVSNAISQSVTSLISSVLTLVGAFAMMIYYGWVMALLVCVTVPLTITVSTKLAKFMRKYFVRQQKLLGKINGQVEETVTSYKTVVAYGREEKAEEDFAESSEELKKCSIKAKVWGSVMGPCMNFLGNLQYVLIAAVGGFFALYDVAFMKRITIGSIQSMLQYSKKFTRPVNEIANQYAAILTALAGAERIFEIMDSVDEIDDGCAEVRISEINGNIEFEQIDFAYEPEEPVLRGLLTDEQFQLITTQTKLCRSLIRCRESKSLSDSGFTKRERHLDFMCLAKSVEHCLHGTTTHIALGGRLVGGLFVEFKLCVSVLLFAIVGHILGTSTKECAKEQ